MGHFNLVGADQRPDPEVHPLQAVVLRHHLRFFSAFFHSRHIPEPHDGAATVRHDEFLKLVHGTQVRIREQIHLHEVALGPADGGQVIVAPQRGLHIAGREVVGRKAIGIDPHAHSDLPSTFNRDALHPGQGGQLRLQGSQQPIRQRRHGPLRRRETEIKRRIGAIGTLHFHRRRFRLSRQLRPDLLQPRRHFGQCRRAVVVQLQMHGHGADAGATRGFEIIHPADRRHDSLDRRGEEPPHRLCRGSIIDRRDDDRRALDLRILLHGQRRQRPPAHEDDHEVDDHGQHGVLDEDVGKRTHGPAPLTYCWLRRCSGSGVRAGSPAATTSTPSRNLNAPDAATRSPAFRPL